MRDPSWHSYAPMRTSSENGGDDTAKENRAMMTKNLALAASITTMVVISGLASARARGT
jgi:hypothetical protein